LRQGDLLTSAALSRTSSKRLAREAGEIAGLFRLTNVVLLQGFRAAFHLSTVHQTKAMEPAKRRNIANLLSLSGGQCMLLEEEFR
jgi:hypothetical protein